MRIYEPHGRSVNKNLLSVFSRALREPWKLGKISLVAENGTCFSLPSPGLILAAFLSFDPLRHHSKRNTKENLQNKTRMVEFGTLARETASSHFRWLISAINACLARTIICTDTSPRASYKYVTMQIERRYIQTIQSRYNYRLKNIWLE